MEKIWVDVHYDKKSYNVKPDKAEIARINSRITNNRKKISVDVLADLVGNRGKAFLPALFNGARQKVNFIEQQIYVLDFDNDFKDCEKRGIAPGHLFTLEECLQRCKEYGLYPSFMYHSLRSKPDHPKFRLVFVNDVPIGNLQVAEAVTSMLIYLFPESDPICRDVTHMYLGGKELYRCNDNTMINIHQVALAFQNKLKEEDEAHYTRNLKSKAHKMGIEVKNNLVCIYQNDIEDVIEISEYKYLNKYGENREIPLIYISRISRFSPLFYTVVLHKKNHSTVGFDKLIGDPLKEIKLPDTVKSIAASCQLFRDFIENADQLSHEQKCVIASSLIYIRGGKRIFMNALIDNQKKWETDWRYFSKNNYHPWHCTEDRCPYYGNCKGPNLYSRMSGRRIEVIGPPLEFVSEEEAYKKLLMAMEESLSSDNRCLNLITAQTGLGKTEAYCDLIADNILSGKARKPFLIAVPTHTLQKEIACRLHMKGVDTVVTHNYEMEIERIGLSDLASQIQVLYDNGLGTKVETRIKEYMKKSDIPAGAKEALKTILEEHKKVQDIVKSAKNCIVTTHALFLKLHEETLEKYEVIIDEDILQDVFQHIYRIPIADVKKAIKEGLLPDEAAYEKILTSDDKTIHRIYHGKYPSDKLEMLYARDGFLNANIPALYEAASVYVQKDNKGNYLHCFVPSRIPNAKMTVASATADPSLYESICGKDRIIHHAIPKVKYKGVLKQYYAHSLSRTDVNEIGYSKLKKSVDAVTGDTEMNTITFKKDTAPDNRIYYGASSGLDTYAGNDLAVIGTPHYPDFIYKLIGSYLGCRTDDRLQPRIIEYNGFRFKFHTFSREDLRAVQLYLIHSELEQAVGRARLLRNDCTVYLFSNVPLEQADLHQEEYILESTTT